MVIYPCISPHMFHFPKTEATPSCFAEGIREICLVGYMMFSLGYLMMVLGFPWRLQNGDVLACLRGRCACGASVGSWRTDWDKHFSTNIWHHFSLNMWLWMISDLFLRVNEMYQAGPTSWWFEGPCLHWPSSGHVTLPTCRGCVFFQQLVTHATHCRSLSFHSMSMFGEFLAQCQCLLLS